MEGSQSVSQTEYSLVPFSSDEILRNGWLFLQSQIQRCSGHIAIPVNIVCDMVLRKYVSVIITENLFVILKRVEAGADPRLKPITADKGELCRLCLFSVNEGE